MNDQIKIAICEDERTQLDYIRSLIDTWAGKNEILCKVDGYVSSEQLLYSFDKDFPYLIYILDIQMGEINGMELARRIRKQDRHAVIIFITGLREYALEGYEVGAMRYLLKPVKENELFDILNEILYEKKVAGDEYFLLEMHDEIHKISYDDIWYVMSKGHYVEMAYGEKKVEWKASIRSIQELFEKNGFVMTTRGLLVNLRRIARVGKTECLLDNGESVSISRNQYKKVNETFIEYYKDY